MPNSAHTQEQNSRCVQPLILQMILAVIPPTPLHQSLPQLSCWWHIYITRRWWARRSLTA
jgi:hypothetical protein